MRDLGFLADLRACLAARDQRARENAAARQRCRDNPELGALLAADARRRGLPAVDWQDYFRQIGINYP